MTTINAAGVQLGLQTIPDNSGTLVLQTNGVNAVYIDNVQTVTANTTGALRFPSGTTAQQPSNLIQGMTRYNTSNNALEIFLNNAWESLP